MLCGSKALLVVCQVFGIPASLSELMNLCETSTEGTSIRQLINAGKKKGFAVSAKRLSFDKLQNISPPAIVMLKRNRDSNHFVVVDEIRDNGVIVIDPPTFPVRISREEWLSQWQGAVITFGLPKQEGAGPQIRFDSAITYLENISQAHTVKGVFRYRNIGDEPLKINAIDSTCKCTVVFSSQEAIRPNGVGEITTRYLPSNREGSFEYKIKLESNDPRHPLSILTLLRI